MSENFLLEIIRALAALAFTLGLLLVAAKVVRRYGLGLSLPQKSKTAPQLKVLEKLTLNPTTTLYLVQDAAHRHLIATTNQQTTLLQTTPTKKKKA